MTRPGEEPGCWRQEPADAARAFVEVSGFEGALLKELEQVGVDLELGVIRVERSWDPHAGVIEPKSRAGRRSVPIVAALRPHLAARKLRRVVPPASSSASAAGRSTATRSSTGPTRAWKKAGLDPIGLHECRHTLASILIAAGVTAKALSTYLGHSSTQITLDRYGHLMPGNEDEAVALVDAYLRRATASS